MNNKKLSICIPTFNRPEKLIKQVMFVLNEIENGIDSDKIEIIIRDNHSDCKSYNKVINKLAKSNIHLYRNDSNLGLIGNLNALLKDAKGEYVWFIGDDDILHAGIVRKVYENCINAGLIFINHRAVDEQNNVLLKQAFNKSTQKSIHHVFRYSGTTMMFITACVYKRHLLEDIFSTSKMLLSLPFRTSIYCAEKGGVVFIDDILINNVWGDVSWSSNSQEVFLQQIPMDLLASIRFSNNKVNAIYSLVKYCSINYRRMIKFILKKYSSKL